MIPTVEEAALRGRIRQLETLNTELVAALEPFAVEDKVSLVDTLGHITREHIERARAAIAKATG